MVRLPDDPNLEDMVDARVLTEALLIYRKWKVLHLPPDRGAECCETSRALFERLDQLEESLLPPENSVEA